MANVVAEFALPESFPKILKDFTREVLRDQPSDINTYAAEYFANLAAPANGDEGEETDQQRGRK